MVLTYKIDFFENWHCSSGLSAGAGADLLVIKDAEGLPYVPGKTIKGLLKNSLFEIASVQRNIEELESFVDVFGVEGSENADNSKESLPGYGYFSNAVISKEYRNAIKQENKPFLFTNIAQTKIGSNGIAVDGSLRKMEVAIPIPLVGTIENLQQRDLPLIEIALKWTRGLGVHRNHGLGKCTFTQLNLQEI